MMYQTLLNKEEHRKSICAFSIIEASCFVTFKWLRIQFRGRKNAYGHIDKDNTLDGLVKPGIPEKPCWLLGAVDPEPPDEDAVELVDGAEGALEPSHADVVHKSDLLPIIPDPGVHGSSERGKVLCGGDAADAPGGTERGVVCRDRKVTPSTLAPFSSTHITNILFPTPLGSVRFAGVLVVPAHRRDKLAVPNINVTA